MPKWPSAIAFSSSSASSLLWCSWRSAPVAAPAAPNAGTPDDDGGKIPVRPHPRASQAATRAVIGRLLDFQAVPSSFALDDDDTFDLDCPSVLPIGLSSSYAAQAASVSSKSATASVYAPSVTAAASMVD